MPSIVNTTMKINKRTPKVKMLGIVLTILAISTLNDVQFRASLNTLKRRMLLRMITPLPILMPLIENIMLSTMLIITIKASKRLKRSLEYSTSPSPKSFIIISAVNSQLQSWFKTSRIWGNLGGSGNLSRVMSAALITIIKVNANEKNGLVQTL